MQTLTIANFLNDEGVKADLVNALLQAICHIDLLYFTMQALHFRVTQLRTQDLIIELLYTHTHTHLYYANINQNSQIESYTLCTIGMVLKILVHFIIKGTRDLLQEKAISLILQAQKQVSKIVRSSC